MYTPLTEKQKAFAIAYVNSGGNRKQAAITAGYHAKRADQSAYQALSSPAVQAAIRKEEEIRIPRSERVHKEHAAHGRFRMIKFDMRHAGLCRDLHPGWKRIFLIFGEVCCDPFSLGWRWFIGLRDSLLLRHDSFLAFSGPPGARLGVRGG
jgi:hypothetical protein